MEAGGHPDQTDKSGTLFPVTITCDDPSIRSSRLWSSVNRYYDPSTDQFLSVDPAVATTGQPYAFTGDDPLNMTDPLGDTAGPPRPPKAACANQGRNKNTCIKKMTKQQKCGRLGCADAKLAPKSRKEALGVALFVGTAGLGTAAVGGAEGVSDAVSAVAARGSTNAFLNEPAVQWASKALVLGGGAHLVSGWLDSQAESESNSYPERLAAKSAANAIDIGDPLNEAYDAYELVK